MPDTSRYPLTVSGPLAGLVLACFAGVVMDDLYAALAFGVLVTAVSLVWRQDDPPVLPFIVVYQWVSVTAGYWYEKAFGAFPGFYQPGDVERTLTIALAGLLVLAVGARVVSVLIDRREGDRLSSASPVAQSGLAVLPLFWIVLAAYGIDYVYTVNAREFGSLASFMQRVLEFRQVLLVTLWLEIVRSRKHVALLFVSFAVAVVPRLGAYYSDFKSPVLLMLLVLAAAWRPWDKRWWPRSILAGIKAAPFAAALIVLLLVWQGGLKRDTRVAYDEGAIGADPAERIAFFVKSFNQELPALIESPEPYVEALIERLSYITFFSRVLEHVPDREPHADGELLRMAMSNAFLPRILVPDKPELPSDSYYTRRFAGVQVAEADTSVSIGYMAEFYADWGLAGMYLSILLYGAWIGVIGAVVRRFAAIPAMRAGAMVVVLLAVSDFEHQFIKGFAALNLNALVTLGLMFALRPHLSRLLRLPAPVALPRAKAAGQPLGAPTR
jgi:hypothetical protein